MGIDLLFLSNFNQVLDNHSIKMVWYKVDSEGVSKSLVLTDGAFVSSLFCFRYIVVPHHMKHVYKQLCFVCMSNEHVYKHELGVYGSY